MKLITIDSGRKGVSGLLHTSGEVLDLGRAAQPGTIQAWLPDSIKGILAAGSGGLDVVRSIAARVERMAPDELVSLRASGALLPAHTRLLAPIPDPGLVVAAGLAYRSHLAEMAGTPPPPHPTAFIKSSNSVGRPGATIALPPHAAEQVDYEGELAVVFGSACHQVSADAALEHVAGYTIANDLSARDWVRPVWDATTPWDARRTWEVNIMGKQYPDFTPLGPVLMTRDEVADIGKLRLTTRLNGAVMQSATLDDLIFPIPETSPIFHGGMPSSPATCC